MPIVYTAADLVQNEKINELAHGLAELTAKVAAIEDRLGPWDDIAKRLLPVVEFVEKLRGTP